MHQAALSCDFHPAVQACEVQPDNTLQLRFAPESDKVCSEISALAILLQPRSASDAAPKRAGCRPSGLSLQTEVHLTIASYPISGTSCDICNLVQRNCDAVSAAPMSATQPKRADGRPQEFPSLVLVFSKVVRRVAHAAGAPGQSGAEGRAGAP